MRLCADLTYGGDTDVGGKNYAWSLKWSGHAPQGQGRGSAHARHTAKGSIELVRRFRARNPNLAGIMPFSAPFYYCGDDVASFADVARHPSAVNQQVRPSTSQRATANAHAAAVFWVLVWAWLSRSRFLSSPLQGECFVPCLLRPSPPRPL